MGRPGATDVRVGRRVVDALRSPRRLTAFAARLARLTLRGELGSLLRRVHARSATAEEYRDWAARKPAPSSSTHVAFVIAVDVEEEVASDRLAEALRKRAGPASLIVTRVDGGWSASVEQAARPLEQWIATHGATWLLWIAAPLELADDALTAFAGGCESADARIVYADHVAVDDQGTASPSFASSWDRIRIVEQPYPAPILAVHAGLVHAVEHASGGVAGQWRFLIDAVESIDEARIVHVPHVVARIAGRDDPVAQERLRAAVVPGLERLASAKGVAIGVDVSKIPWLTYRVRVPAAVSVVIPTRDRPDLVERCVYSVLRGGWLADGEIVVVDNGSTDARLAELLRSLSQRATVRIVKRDIPFNFPLLCNAGVEAARGRLVVLLNNDAEVHEGWLEELVPLAMRSDVGAVGPLIVYPDGLVQSAGVLVGVNRTATSALEGFDERSPAVQAWCASRRRVSAVLGACIAIERDKYLRIGGMDPRFAVSHNEVDFCLRLESVGLANVFTPFARVVHAEGATRGFEVTPAERARLNDEEAHFLARWQRVIDAVDPAHHPAFARSGNPFLLGPPTASLLRPRAGWRGLASAGSGSNDAAAG